MACLTLMPLRWQLDNRLLPWIVMPNHFWCRRRQQTNSDHIDDVIDQNYSSWGASWFTTFMSQQKNVSVHFILFLFSNRKWSHKCLWRREEMSKRVTRQGLISLLPSWVINMTTQPLDKVRRPGVDSWISLLSTLVAKGDYSNLIPDIVCLIEKRSSRVSLTGVLSSFGSSWTNEVVVDSFRVWNCTSFDTFIWFVTFFVGHNRYWDFH